MAYLECNDIRKDYDDFKLRLTLSMEEGEILSIIGPSGSGKSTLLSILCGIEAPDSGNIVLNGKDITLSPIQKREIGMVFQDFSLFPNMNTEQNIQYGMKNMTQSQMDEETARLLGMVGLEGYQKRKVYELSGGEAQRVALARALAAKPKILLLDEPLSALDAPLRKRLRSTIKDIHDSTGITMLYVTHDREEAFAISDRILVMRNGRKEALGRPEDLYSNPPNLFVASFTGEGSTISLDGEKAFLRPEDILICNEERKPNEDEILLKGLKVLSCEYAGSTYNVKLSYKDSIILALSESKPKTGEVNVLVKKKNFSNTKSLF